MTTSTPINKISDEDLAEFDLNPYLNFYQKIATKSAIYPGRGTFFGLQYCTLKLNGEAGELAEHVGKAMRDDEILKMESVEFSPYELEFRIVQREFTPERLEAITKEVGDCLWYLSAICNELGISFAKVAKINLEKLKSRTDRDQLQGSGDNR